MHRGAIFCRPSTGGCWSSPGPHHSSEVPQDWDETLCQLGAGQASSELGSPPRSRAPKSAPAWKQQNQASFGMRLVGTFNAKLQYFRFFFSPALGQDTSATATFLTGQSLRGPGSTGRLRFAGQVRQRTGSPCLHLSCQFCRQSLGQENAPQTTHGWGAPGRHPCLLQAGQRPGACPSNLPEGGLSVVAIPPVN